MIDTHHTSLGYTVYAQIHTRVRIHMDTWVPRIHRTTGVLLYQLFSRAQGNVHMPPRENPSNPALQQMTLAPVRSTGLNSLVPQALPPRTSRSTKDPVWKLCIIIDGNDVKNPLIKRLRCNMQLAAGAEC